MLHAATPAAVRSEEVSVHKINHSTEATSSERTKQSKSVVEELHDAGY
jgi:hypothetical protein